MSCGIASVTDVIGTDDAVEIAIEIAEGLQHRGELGAGIAGAREGMIHVLKGNGSVQEVLSLPKRADFKASSAIAHTRYATSGSRDPSLAQPFMAPDGSFAFGFNGNIANHAEVAAKLRGQGNILNTSVDTELILRLLADKFRQETKSRIGEVFAGLERQLDGSFNISLLTADGSTYAYRNGNGNRPLSYAFVQDRYVITSSEDSAIKRVFPNAETNDLAPGHLLYAEHEKWGTEPITNIEHARCFFEWVYFAHYLSAYDGVSVQGARYQFGQQLAQMDSTVLKDGVVVPVPDSAETAGYGYAHAKRLPLAHGIEKIGKWRTFIAGKEDREEKAKKKYGFHPDLLHGRNIVLVDDSMVRGTTLRALIGRLRSEANVSKIHLRIACPPILAPCYYGIDFSTVAELISRKQWNGILASGTLPPRALAMLAENLGADSIQFLSVEAIRCVLSKHQNGLCMACVTGKYPTEAGGKLYAIESGAGAGACGDIG